MRVQTEIRAVLAERTFDVLTKNAPILDPLLPSCFYEVSGSYFWCCYCLRRPVTIWIQHIDDDAHTKHSCNAPS